MSRAKINDFKNLEFYQVPKWLLKVNGLQPADILIYMLAWNNWKLSERNKLINSKQEVYFYLTHESLKQEFEFGKNQIISALKRLTKCGALISEKRNGYATKFYIELDTSSINFDITSLKKGSALNQTQPVIKKVVDQSEKGDMDQSEKSDINNTVLNKTEYNTELIILKSEIENEKISIELKEKIKEYIDYRKEIKKPLKTYRSIKAMLNKIGKEFLSEKNLIESIENSIMNGYQGVFPLNKKDIPKNNNSNVGESFAAKALRGEVDF